MPGSSTVAAVDLFPVLGLVQLVLLGVVGAPHGDLGSSGDIGLLLPLLCRRHQLLLLLLLVLALSPADLGSRELLLALPVLDRREAVGLDLLPVCLPGALALLLLPLLGLLLL